MNEVLTSVISSMRLSKTTPGHRALYLVKLFIELFLSSLVQQIASYFSLESSYLISVTSVLLYLFLSSSFYLKSDGVSYEQQEFVFLLIGVDIDIHKMKFLFVSTLHLGKPAGYIVTTF